MHFLKRNIQLHAQGATTHSFKFSKIVKIIKSRATWHARPRDESNKRTATNISGVQMSQL
jgi:hypothetical protein